MSAEVRFYPLRLSGLDRSYRGHDGVRAWFERLGEAGQQHRLAVHGLSAKPNGEVMATGELHRDDGADPLRFWARDCVDDGGIVVAHHYLSDPRIFEEIARASRPARPPRFPGL